jgi:hypothetical protein
MGLEFRVRSSEPEVFEFAVQSLVFGAERRNSDFAATAAEATLPFTARFVFMIR